MEFNFDYLFTGSRMDQCERTICFINGAKFAADNANMRFAAALAKGEVAEADKWFQLAKRYARSVAALNNDTRLRAIVESIESEASSNAASGLLCALLQRLGPNMAKA